MTGANAIGLSRRPRAHYTPRQNWLNDPNGLVFHEGRYHLFYQHNPEASEHGNMSWGHASSPDLIQWEEHPLAISYDVQEQIFSGSIVFDENNTSRLGEDGTRPLVAIYTSVDAHTGLQSQAVASSVDDGMTWRKYAHNPVLERGSHNFRDPKVFRYHAEDDAFWVMVSVEATERQVLLHRSDDLLSWSYLSSFGPAGAVAGAWECPDLFPLAVDGDRDRVRWVLVVSVLSGGMSSGSATQYFIGSFDGVQFIPDFPIPPVISTESEGGPRINWLDAGRDCYAGVTFNGLTDEDRVFIAWMSNWDYAHRIPTSPWRGTMTVPRRLSLISADGRPQLRAVPIVADGTLTGELLGTTIESPVALDGLTDAMRVDVQARVPKQTSLRITLGHDAALPNSGVIVSYVGDRRLLQVDRTASEGVHDAFPSRESVVVPGDGELLTLTIILDVGSIEVFAADGLRSITDLVFGVDMARGILVEADGGPVEIIALRTIDLGGEDD
jgi:sucrose-6-phosphate hydrolase SacC (GH32 family)